MIESIIIEDEAISANVLRKMLERYCPEVKVIAQYDSVQSAIKNLTSDSVNLIFMDVELVDGTGFEILENFQHSKSRVVFVTAHDHYAIKAIKFNALDYLLKPLDADDLKKAVQKYRNQLFLTASVTESKAKNKEGVITQIALPSIEGLVFVKAEEIIRCEADGSYTHIYLTNNRKTTSTKPLGHYEEILPANFCRVHYAHVVNTNHIVRYFKGRGGMLQLSENHRVQVSVRRLPYLKEKFTL